MNQSSLLLVIRDSNTTVKQNMTTIKYNGFYGLMITKQTYIRTGRPMSTPCNTLSTTIN